MKVFVIAMDSEAAPVLGAMKLESKTEKFGKKIYTGSLYGTECAVIVCGVGKVNAASGTAAALALFNPDRVINLGVAGGLNPSVQVGKIYGISSAVQYDFDLCQLNGKAIGTLDGFEENYLPLQTPPTFPLKKLGTGDRFNDDKKDYKLLTETLGADIREMEGAAVAQVCLNAGVGCEEYKIISDLAGSGSTTEQYRKNLDVCFGELAKNLEKIINGNR